MIWFSSCYQAPIRGSDNRSGCHLLLGSRNSVFFNVCPPGCKESIGDVKDRPPCSCPEEITFVRPRPLRASCPHVCCPRDVSDVVVWADLRPRGGRHCHVPLFSLSPFPPGLDHTPAYLMQGSHLHLTRKTGHDFPSRGYFWTFKVCVDTYC